MAEYVVDADECDQQPYEERDKETKPGSKVGEQCCNLTDHIRLPTIHTKTYI